MKKENARLINIENYRERKAAREATQALLERSGLKSQIPKMPRRLNSKQKIWWKRIMQKVDKSLLLPADVFALELLVSALAMYDRTKEEAEKRGRPSIYKTMLRDLRVQISQLLEKFFLTPDCFVEEGWLEQVGRKKNAWPKYKIKPEGDFDW
jgi:phage terminase small subunit